MKTGRHVIMKPDGRRHSASDQGNSISAAWAGFGVHVSMSE